MTLPLAESEPSALTVPANQKQLSLAASVGSASAAASAAFSTSLQPSVFEAAASAIRLVTVAALHVVKSQLKEAVAAASTLNSVVTYAFLPVNFGKAAVVITP